jgi:hypothetical protein
MMFKISLEELKDLKSHSEVITLLKEKETGLLKELKEIQEQKARVQETLLSVPDRESPEVQRQILFDHLCNLDEKEAQRLSLYFFKLVFPVEFEKAEIKSKETGKAILVPRFLEPCPASRIEVELRRIRTALKTPQELERQRSNFDLESIRQIPFESIYSFEKTRDLSERLSAICPFHAEDSPSFVVYKLKNNAHCFGCSWHGDVISFHMKLNDTSFIQTCRELSTLL